MFRPVSRLLGLLSLVAGVAAFCSGEDAGSVVPVDASAIPLVVDSGSFELSNLNDATWLKGGARRSLAVGVYDVAYSLAKRAEELEAGDSLDFENALVLVDSLLAQGEWVEARSRLTALEGADDDGGEGRLRLREAMIAYAESDVLAVADRLSGVVAGDLPVGDAAWFWFLSGWVKQADGELEAAAALFDSARSVALGDSPALSGQIGYLVFRSLLESGTAGAETVPQLQNALLENEGREVRFLYAEQLAVLLYDSGDRDASIELIAENLAVIPDGLAREKAQFQLLATMAAGLERVEGRQALNELLSANAFPGLMSIALQQAFSQARLPEGEGGSVLRGVLDGLINGGEHALLDQAYYYRAVFRFLDGDYVGAEADAAELQRLFPSSPYRRGMLALQASSAWNRKRYRTAANRLQLMRTEFSELAKDFRLSALIADCYLRAGLQSSTREDYGNAAEAYATALANVTSVSQGGPLFFQLVFSRLRAGQLDLALEAIDSPSLRVLAGGEMIWRAQWMALREMRRVGRVSDAYERAQEAVLAESENPFLKLRLLWLTARLSVVSGDPEYTIDWVKEIEAFIASEALVEADKDLLNKVLASSLLSLSEAHFALGEPEEAVALLKRLRADYAGYESALLSYISEARYLSNVNRTVEAQQLLVSLADEYPEHRLAPLALFEAALNAARRGQDAYLDEATKLLQRIANDYPDSGIVFRARLMQADLLRRLNKFGSAEQIYFLLENEYADRPDRFLAQMSMSDTLKAQADQDPRKFELAVSRLELLRDLPEAPPDLRVEAGYKLGEAWRSRGENVKAKQLFWLIYDQVLGDDLEIRKLSNKGRYWVSRCLFGLAELSKEEGNVDQANFFLLKVIEHRLDGVELARDRLEMLEKGVEAGPEVSASN